MNPDPVGPRLASALGSGPAQTLREWAAQKKRRYELDRCFDEGRTGAMVCLVHENDSHRGSVRKLVLKLDRPKGDDFTTTEYARHLNAIEETENQQFVRDHLAELAYDPLPVVDGRWIVFQKIATGSLEDYDTLSSLVTDLLETDQPRHGQATVAKVCRRIAHGVLSEWARAPQHRATKDPPTVAEFLTMHLGTRFPPGSKPGWCAWDAGDATIPVVGESRLLPNPFTLLWEDSGISVPALIGHAHGDLNGGNILVRTRADVNAGDFRLIDLAKYSHEAPLTRDPVHLVLHIIARNMQHLEFQKGPLIDVLLDDRRGARASLLPGWITEIITSVYDTAEDWIHPTGYLGDWRQQTRLSTLACALMFLDRATTRPEDREWFLRLAARAAEPFATAPKTAPVPAAPTPILPPSPARTPRADGSRAHGAERFIVGRAKEIGEFDALLSADAPHRLLNIYGPGGIGKTEVYRKLRRHAAARPCAAADLGAGDLSVHRVLADFTATLSAAEGMADVFAPVETRLREYEVARLILHHGGGLNALYGPLGRPRDQAALDALLDGLDPPLSPSLRKTMQNRFAFDRYLQSAERELTWAFADALGSAAEKSTVPLLIDTYEEGRALDSWVCRTLVPALPPGVRMVILGRNQLTKQNIDWSEHLDDLTIQALPELGKEEAQAYLRHYGLTDPAGLNKVYEFTGGYPLLLVLVRVLVTETGGWAAVNDMEHSSDRNAIAARLLDRILREQAARELRDVLEKCAVAAWINAEIIAKLLGVPPTEGQALFEKLEKHSFVERHPRGVKIHDKVRELLGERLKFNDPAEFDRLQSLLADYYAEKDAEGGGGLS